MAQTVSAIQVAREFAALARQDEDENFTAMKLQKLLYYAQAWALHKRGLPLFAEKIKAWENGPVVPEVYQKFRGRYGLNLNSEELAPDSGLEGGDKELVFGVWQLYKRFSGDDLSAMTHEHVAWSKARERASVLSKSPPIRHEDMPREVREYLAQQEAQCEAFVRGLMA